MVIVSQIVAAVYGLLLGVIVNYLADVLPYRRQLAEPQCRFCGARIPVIQYFFWPRQCPECKRKRSLRVWVVEMGMIVSGLLLLEFASPKLGVGISGILLGYLVLVTVIDLENRLILHVTSLFGALFTFGVGAKLHGFTPTLLGGAAGFGIMLGFYIFGFAFIRLVRKFTNRPMEEQEAIGFGDVNLSGIIGLLLGWPGVVLGLLLAVLIGGLVSLFVLIWNRYRGSYHPDLAVPYGPFLTIGAAVLIFLRPLMP